jgi:mono/diheme cytochrome c family protein
MGTLDGMPPRAGECELSHTPRKNFLHQKGLIVRSDDDNQSGLRTSSRGLRVSRDHIPSNGETKRAVTRKIAATAAVCGAVLVAVTGRAGSAETLVERGAYLVTTIGACGNCHTPRDAAGKPMADMALAGGFEFDDGPIGHVVVRNITPDPETGIGKWTEAQIVTALRDGKRPDGTVIGPPMPIRFYRQLSDGDAAAIAAYLRSLKPISHEVGRTLFKDPPPPWSPVTHVDEPPQADRVAYGGYLVGPVGHCTGCHTPAGAGGPNMSRAFAGGRQLPDFGNPGAETVSRNVTPDPEHGVGRWSDDDIKRTISTCVRPDGTPLSRTMACDWYAKIASDDLNAIVAYLRSLKPLKTE